MGTDELRLGPNKCLGNDTCSSSQRTIGYESFAPCIENLSFAVFFQKSLTLLTSYTCMTQAQTHTHTLYIFIKTFQSETHTLHSAYSSY